jgi:anti-sigma28 factor (negative regulator of flagellin synthesis)
MNINNVSNINVAYSKSGISAYKDNISIHNVKSGSALSEEKTDVVSISSKAVAHKEINKKTAEIAENVKNAVSVQHIQDIKTKIQNGTYAVSSGVVADAVLAHVIS